MNICWQYGLLEPLDWTADTEAQVAAQTSLWNRLMQIQANYVAAVRETLRRDDDYRTADDRLSMVENELAAIEAEDKRRRKNARGRVPLPSPIAESYRDLHEDQNRLWMARSASYRCAKEVFKGELAQLAQARYAGIGDAGREMIAKKQLWWGNTNAVISSFDAALRQLQPGQSLRRRAEGLAGPGRLTVQLQGGLSRADLFAGCCKLVAIGEHWGKQRNSTSARGHVQTRLLTFTYYRDPGNRQDVRTVHFPIVLHRPFPDGEDVRIHAVSLQRRRVGIGRQGPRYRWTVSFNLRVPDPIPTGTESVAGIDIGWRKVEDGVRVATIAGSDSARSHLILPRAWLDKRNKASEMASRGAAMCRALRPRLTGLGIDAEASWRTIRDAVLAIQRWPADLADDLAKWVTLERSRASMVRRLDNQRRELYRVAAKAIAEHYGTVILDQTSVAKLARQRANMPPETRRMRTWAAPSELMAAISRAVLVRGGTLEKRTGPTTQTCHLCGHVSHPQGQQRINLMWRCPSCRALWDQDENAAINLLMRRGDLKLKRARPKVASIARRRRAEGGNLGPEGAA